MPAPEQVTLQRIVDIADDELRELMESEIRRGRLTPLEARAFLTEVLPGWGGMYEDAAATVAADLYEQKRLAEGVDFVPHTISLAEPATEARWAILSSWAVPVGAEDVDWDSVFQLIVGGAHRTIADAHRNTTIRNAIADPASRGWQRVGRGAGSCNFCLMLISRRNVYTEESVKFRSHDNCRCSAESAFHSVNNAEMRAFERSARKSGWEDWQHEEERARARSWFEANID